MPRRTTVRRPIANRPSIPLSRQSGESRLWLDARLTGWVCAAASEYTVPEALGYLRILAGQVSVTAVSAYASPRIVHSACLARVWRGDIGRPPQVTL